MTSGAPIFISFASKDRKVADGICVALENRGFRCWISSRDVEGGENFQEAIVHSLRAAKVMVLVFTANANNSEPIKREVALAGQFGLVVIPLRVEDIVPNDAFVFEFATRQWIDLFGDWERAIERLCERLAAVMPSPSREGTFEPTGSQLTAPIAPPPPDPVKPFPAAAAVTVPVTDTATGHAQGEVSSSKRLEAGAKVPDGGSNATIAAPRRIPKIAIIVAICVVIVIGIVGVVTLMPSGSPTTVRGGATADEALARGLEAGRAKNYPDAIKWFTEAAEQGNSPAQNNLGYLYMEGRGVKQDYAEAMTWYRKAAEQGNATALNNIGHLYQNGLGVEHNYTEAMNAYRKAAEQGNATAQNNIGFLYQRGWGVKQDYVEAMNWYRKAADQRNATAQNSIGLLYENGWGVKQDYTLAMTWYRKAADQGYPVAEYNIGSLYEEGKGVPANLNEARKWMEKSAQAGDSHAKGWLAAH